METMLELFAVNPVDERMEAFKAYDRENPQIWDAFCRMAYDDARNGEIRLSSKFLFERLRHDPLIKKTYGATWKANNNWTGYYARKFMRLYPQFDGVFEIRGEK